MGHRQDLIIKKNETLELGVGEEKPYDNNTNMILERSMRCPKAMKDTLLQLFENVNYDSKLMKSLNVIGLLTFGKHKIVLCSFFYLISPFRSYVVY